MLCRVRAAVLRLRSDAVRCALVRAPRLRAKALPPGGTGLHREIVGARFGQGVGSPVDAKLAPATGLPEARRSRIFSRLGPAWLMASTRVRSAWSTGVPSGRRKIQGMLVEVSARSEEIATTGRNVFTAICSAR